MPEKRAINYLIEETERKRHTAAKMEHDLLQLVAEPRKAMVVELTEIIALSRSFSDFDFFHNDDWE